LKEACGEILAQQLSPDNVFYLLDLCEKYSCMKLRESCAEYLAENFEELLKADKLMDLDADTWAEMLKSDEIEVSSEAEVYQAVLRYVNQFDKEKRDKSLEKILPSIRFGLLPAKLLIQIEEDPKLTSIGVVHTLLHETYRNKACPGTTTSIRFKPRKGTSWFDITVTAGGIKLSDDNRTAINENRTNQWKTVKVMPSFSQGPRYKEFKINQSTTSGFFIGVVANSALSTLVSMANMYPGQQGITWSYEGSGGNLYHNSSTTPYGGPYKSGDRIGIMMDLDECKLEFYKNGKALGKVPSFTKPTSSEEFFAVVCFYGYNDSATLVNTSSPDPEGVEDSIPTFGKTVPQKKKEECRIGCRTFYTSRS